MKKILFGIFLLIAWFLSVENLVNFESQSLLLNVVILPIRILAVTFWPLAGIGVIWLAWEDDKKNKRIT